MHMQKHSKHHFVARRTQDNMKSLHVHAHLCQRCGNNFAMETRSGKIMPFTLFHWKRSGPHCIDSIEPWWHCTWTEHPTQSMLGLTPGLSRRSRHNLSLASTHIQSALVWTAIVPLESHKTLTIYASSGRSCSQGTIKSPALVHFLFTWSIARTRTWPQTTLLIIWFSPIFLLCLYIHLYICIIYIYIHVHIHIHSYIYTYICTYVCIHIHIFIYGTAQLTYIHVFVYV